MPPGVAQVLAQPQTLARELAYLEARVAAAGEESPLARRVANLRSRIAAADHLQKTMRDEVRDRLGQITADAQMAAAERQVEACYRRRLEQVAGPLPSDLTFTADLLNATLLAISITTHRHLLLRLLRAYVAGDRAWPQHHPANVAFLQTQATRGVDTAAWLTRHPRLYPCPLVAGGRLRLYLETDSLRILQMGNYFDTCLSFGGVNAFSTVANACDLNKRVVYAEDGNGRVIARKLIAINAEGQLVGFHTYTVLPDPVYRAVQDLVGHYLRAFAARCGLTLAEQGQVLTLVAEQWYDDGIVSWGSDPPRPPSSIPPTARRPTASGTP